MALKTKSRSVGSRYALDGPVEKGLVSTSQIRGETLFFNGEAMILTRDKNLSCLEVLNRVVRSVVPMDHFLSICPTSQR